MKKINIFLFAILGVMSFVSCSDTEDPKIGKEYKAPVLDALTPQNLVITEDTDLSKNVAEWEWSKADFGISTQITYTVEADTLGGDFTSPITITTSTDVSAPITAGMLNKAALMFVSKITPVSLDIRLKVTISPMIEPIYSNIQSITFTPSMSAGYPEKVYMIGDEFGGWDWASAGVVEMTPVNGLEGVFWSINYYTAGKGFKWAPTKAWGQDFPELNTNVGFSVSGGNASVDKDGLYITYIDFVTSKITVEPAKVFGIGDCFGSWDSEKYPFTVDADGKTMSIKTTGNGELRMYASSSAASTDWWTREFIILDGKIVYRGNGGDQERVSVQAGKTVTLDFRVGTGTIK